MAVPSSYKESLMAIPSPNPPRRSRRKRLVFSVVLGAVSLTACGGGPGNEEDLVAALTRDDTFTVGQAECIAAKIFVEYGEDEVALTMISNNADYDELIGTDGVAGFDEFFSTAITVCTF